MMIEEKEFTDKEKKAISNHPSTASIDSKPINENFLRKVSIISVVDYGTMSDETALSFFELYLVLLDLSRFQINIEERYNDRLDLFFLMMTIKILYLSDRNNLKLIKFHEFFKIPFKRWIELIKIKLQSQIDKLAEAEKVWHLLRFINSN